MKNAKNAYLGLKRIINFLQGKCTLSYGEYLEIAQLPCYICEVDPKEAFFDEKTGSVKRLHRITRLNPNDYVHYSNAIPICIQCRNQRRTKSRENNNNG
jgi:hypothetical protein